MAEFQEGPPAQPGGYSKINPAHDLTDKEFRTIAKIITAKVLTRRQSYMLHTLITSTTTVRLRKRDATSISRSG